MSAFVKWWCDVCGNSTEGLVPLERDAGNIEEAWYPDGWGFRDGKTYCSACEATWREWSAATNPNDIALA